MQPVPVEKRDYLIANAMPPEAFRAIYPKQRYACLNQPKNAPPAGVIPSSTLTYLPFLAVLLCWSHFPSLHWVKKLMLEK